MKRLGAFAGALIAHVATAAPSWTETAEFGSSHFLIPWTSTSNNEFDAALTASYKSPRTVASAQIRLSNDYGPLMGNLIEANHTFLLGSHTSLSLGRMAPETSLIQDFGTFDHLNQKVCFNPFDCVRGGLIGAQLQAESFTIGMQIADVPNFSPGPKLATDGGLSSSNRWAEAPIQYVEVNGQLLPLKNGVTLPSGLAPLFYPGLRVSYDFLSGFSPGTSNSLRWISQAAPGPSPAVSSHQGLTFVTNPTSGDVQLVAGNEMTVTFPFVQSHHLQYKDETSEIKSFAEISYERSFDDKVPASGSAIVGLRPKIFGWATQFGVGGFSVGPARSPFTMLSIHRQISKITLSLGWTQFIAQAQRATYLHPQIDWQATSRQTISLYSHLILAQESAFFFGSIRGNDFVGLRWQHEI